MLKSAFWVKVRLTDLRSVVLVLSLGAHLKAILAQGGVPALLEHKQLLPAGLESLAQLQFYSGRKRLAPVGQAWGLGAPCNWILGLSMSFFLMRYWEQKNTGRASPPCEAPRAPAASSCSGRSADLVPVLPRVQSVMLHEFLLMKVALVTFGNLEGIFPSGFLVMAL